MSESFSKKAQRFWRAEFLSPKDLLERAAVITLLFVIAHVAGLRDFTSVVAGTVGSVALGRWASSFLGISYLLLYMGVVLLVPTSVAAAAIILVWQRLARRNPNR
jgi:hypothetical protein